MKKWKRLPALVGAVGLAAAFAISAAPSPAHGGATHADSKSPAELDNGYPGAGMPAHLRSPAPTGPAGLASVPPPPGYSINGRDVSSHDHSNGKTVDWAAQRAAGDEFAFVKATERTNYVNPYFNQDFNGAKAAGLYVGAYVFGRPDLGDPVGQANFFVNHMQWSTDGRTLPPFLDLEWPYTSGTPTCYGLSQAEMRNWISSFLTTVEGRTGRTPMIYTNVNWWNPCTGNSAAFSRYPLDIASCNSTAPSVPGWGNGWTFWQYDIPECGRGSTVDSNVFNGTVAQLARLAGGTPPPVDDGSVQFADVDGDGRDEIISILPDGRVAAYRNLGWDAPKVYDGAASKIVAGGFTDALRTKFADIDGDGRDEIVSILPDGRVAAYRNKGWDAAEVYDGADSKIVATGFTDALRTKFADIDGDRRDEIVSVFADGRVAAYRNLGWDAPKVYDGAASKIVAGGFTDAPRTKLADIDGDRRDEIVSILPDGRVAAYRNLGWDAPKVYDGAASKIVAGGFTDARRTKFGDIDGDGRDEIISVYPDGNVAAFLNLGWNATNVYDGAYAKTVANGFII